MLFNYQKKLLQKEHEENFKQKQIEKGVKAALEKEERANTRLFKKALRRTRSKSPFRKNRHTELQMKNLPLLKQAENYESNMFPLTKTDSLDNIMYEGLSNKAQSLGMSTTLNNARAKSAHALGKRLRSASLGRSFIHPRVESSQHPQARE